MCLPEKVTEHFTALTDRVLELKLQNGGTYNVGLIRSGGKLILQPGWSDFVSANNISQNDLLLFKFMGGPKFEVQIFDPRGLEKINDAMEVVSTTKITSLEPDNRHLKGSDEVKMKLPPIKGTARKYCKLGEKGQHKCCNNFSYNNEKEEKMCDKLSKNKEVRQHQSYIGAEQTNQGLMPGNELFGALHQEKAELHEHVPVMRTDTTKEQSQNLRKYVAPSNEFIYLSKKAVLSAEQKRRVELLAREVQARNPAFLKVITRYGLTSTCRISIPAKFAAEHLPVENRCVVLCRPKNKKEMAWPIKYYYSKQLQTIEGFFWRKFVHENNLQEGDVCLFEMVESAKQIKFLVHISGAICDDVGVKSL